LSENFKQFALVLNKFTNTYNDGHVTLLNFGYDGNLSYNTGFTGGYNFSSSHDYKLKFKSLNTVNRSVVLNILFFSPSMLNLENGNLDEILSSEWLIIYYLKGCNDYWHSL